MPESNQVWLAGTWFLNQGSSSLITLIIASTKIFYDFDKCPFVNMNVNKFSFRNVTGVPNKVKSWSLNLQPWLSALCHTSFNYSGPHQWEEGRGSSLQSTLEKTKLRRTKTSALSRNVLSMDQITKDEMSSFLVFIDWRYSESCGISTPLVNLCPSNLLTGSPTRPSFLPCVNKYGIPMYPIHTVCNRGGGRGSGCVESIYDTVQSYLLYTVFLTRFRT